MRYILTRGVLLQLILALIAGASAFNANILEALMLESLRDNRVQACDGETITLHCPRNTHVLVQTVFYGRLVPSAELCPAAPAGVLTNNTLFDARGATLSPLAVRTPSVVVAAAAPAAAATIAEDTSCDMPDAHERVTDACRGKRKCRVVVRPSFFGERDACPTTRKYLQVSYKCKPISFEDQSFCEGTTMQLACRAHKRLSIYSAQYGRTVNGQSQRCDTPSVGGGVPPAVHEDCVFDVLPQVLRQCHAQAACALAVNDHFFGNPCVSAVGRGGKQFSLIYMCVNDEVFSESALLGTLESMRALEEEAITTTPNQTTAALQHYHTKTTPKGSVKATVEELELSEELSDEDDDYSYESDDDKEVFLGKRMPAKAHDDTANAQSVDNVRVESIDDFDSYDDNERRITKVDYSTTTIITGVPRATSSVGVIDTKGLGFAEDFSVFVRYLKENHEESLLYFFLFISLGLIVLLALCLCYHLRDKSRSHKLRFGLFMTRSKTPKHKLFGIKNYQTVSVSSGGVGAPASFSSTVSTSSTSSGSGGSNTYFYNNKLATTNKATCDSNTWRRPTSVTSSKRIPYSARTAVVTQHQQQQYDADLNALIENSANNSPFYSDSDGSRPLNRLDGSASNGLYMQCLDSYGSSYGIVDGSGIINGVRPYDSMASTRPNFSRSYGTGLAEQDSGSRSEYAGRGGFSDRRPSARTSSTQIARPSLLCTTPQMRRIAAIATPTSADLARYGALQYNMSMSARSAVDNPDYDARDATSGYAQYATAASLADTTLPRAPVSLHHYS